jgi:hypothetical protein
MAPTPRPDGWKGGSESFGFLRTFDGHLGTDKTGSSNLDRERFGYANVRWGFDQADLGGDYYGIDPSFEDIHGDERDD